MTRICPDPEPEQTIEAIYKPTIGERPLDDFPDGTLTRREVAAWHVSEASGWDIVPPTILRDGPFGEGMVQAFIDADPGVDVVAMVVEDDPRLRRMAVLDAIIDAILAAWYGQYALYLIVAALAYHLANGIRHLVFDTGMGLTPGDADTSAWFAILFGIAAPIGLWALLTFGA